MEQQTNWRSLVDFIFNDQRNRIYLILAIIASAIIFTFFKVVLYPYPNFCASSYSFIAAANINADVNLWPIGYSKFIWLFHHITHSATVLVSFQFAFLTLVMLYFFYTVHYFYRLGKDSLSLLFLFLFFDPLFFYLSNYIVSDALFLGVSLWWFTQLIWILHRPKAYQIISNALLIFLAFTLSYNAIYYPLIALVVFWLSQQRLARKVLGFLLCFPLLILFVVSIQEANYRQTGQSQLSAFSGWRQAGDALYAYPSSPIDIHEIPVKYAALNDTVNTYFRTVTGNRLLVSPSDGFFYVTDRKTPLFKYVALKQDLDHPYDEFKRWGSVSPLYGEYGRYFVRTMPGAYFKEYLVPNTREYFWPIMDKLAVYNMSKDTIGKVACSWFEYPNGTRVISDTKHLEITLLSPFPIFFLMLNIVFFVGTVWVIATRRSSDYSPVFLNGLVLVSSFLLINACYSILSAPVVFESQIFSTIICFVFVIQFYELLEKRYKK